MQISVKPRLRQCYAILVAGRSPTGEMDLATEDNIGGSPFCMGTCRVEEGGATYVIHAEHLKSHMGHYCRGWKSTHA